MKVHWPILFLVLAGATARAEWQAAFSLTDGSRIVGQPVAKALPLQADGVGAMEIPWDRIRAIQISDDHRAASVQLLNRDQVQGRITGNALSLETLFGIREVPVSLIRQVHFRRAGGRDVLWDVLPIAPRDLDARPAAPAKVDEGELTLDGWQVRSRRTFARPVTFECTATLQKAVANDAALSIRFVPVDEPRDAVPARAVVVMVGHRGNGRQFVTVSRNDAPPAILYEEIGRLNVGEPYAIRVTWTDDKIEVGLNDSTFVTRAVTAWYERFHIDLAGGQYGDTWRVADCVVRNP